MYCRRHSKALVIASRPVGYTAAFYASLASLGQMQIEGTQPGGQSTNATDVENWPGNSTVLFREEVLSRGATRPAAESFRALRGRDADPTALRKRKGLVS